MNELMAKIEKLIVADAQRKWEEWSGDYNNMVKSRDHWLGKYATSQRDMAKLEGENIMLMEKIDSLKAAIDSMLYGVTSSIEEQEGR